MSVLRTSLGALQGPAGPLRGLPAQPPTTPDTIAGLQLWIDSTAITGLSDTNPVSSWLDLSGNGNHAAQSTPDFQPVYRTGILGGLPVVRFDGSNDRLITPQFQHGASFTIFAVARQTSGTAARSIVDSDYSGRRQFQFRTNNATSLQLITFTSTVTPVVTDSQPVTAGNWNVLGGVARTSEAQAYVNGATDGATARSGTPAAFVSQVMIGAGYGGATTPAQFLAGDIAEVCVYGRDLDAAERVALEGYLASHWSL
jgi:hypothetical protein